MLFFSFFKTLVGQEVTVELKNGVMIKGQLVSVDQYLNAKLKNISVEDGVQYPQLGALKACFVRGSVIRFVFIANCSCICLRNFCTFRYIHIPANQVDTELLQDAARKENSSR